MADVISAFRRDLEARHGETWNTEELGRDFTVLGFSYGIVAVTRKVDGVKGSLEFDGGFNTSHPRESRVYFNFVEARR